MTKQRPSLLPTPSADEPQLADAALKISAHYHHKADALLEILHDVQEAFGFIPKPALPALAKALNLSRAEIYGVVSFYHDFRQQPAGAHVIKLCQSEACQAMRGRALQAAVEKWLKLSVGETSADGKVTLEAVYCLGLCAVAPAAMVDGQLVARASVEKMADLVNEAAS